MSCWCDDIETTCGECIRSTEWAHLPAGHKVLLRLYSSMVKEDLLNLSNKLHTQLMFDILDQSLCLTLVPSDKMLSIEDIPL